MRSIFGMPSDDLAGDAQRRVPLQEEGKCVAFLECLPTIWQVTRSGACRYITTGDAKRRVQYIIRRFYL